MTSVNVKTFQLNFRVPFIWRSLHFFGKSFFFPIVVLSILRYFPFHVVHIYLEFCQHLKINCRIVNTSSFIFRLTFTILLIVSHSASMIHRDSVILLSGQAHWRLFWKPQENAGVSDQEKSWTVHTAHESCESWRFLWSACRY